MTFYEWLTKQGHRDDAVGIFANYIINDPEAPKSDWQLADMVKQLQYSAEFTGNQTYLGMMAKIFNQYQVETQILQV